MNNREITEEIPLSFIDGDQARAVEVEYILHKDGTVGFRLKDQVTYTTLTIDPVLEWGSYFNLASGTDQLYNIKFFVQDQMPQNPAFKVHMNFVYAGGVPFGPPDDVQNRNTLRMPPYRRVDIGFSWYYLENKKIRKGTEYVSPHQGSYLNKFTDIWFRLEVFNLLNINNTISYLWVTDVLNRQYAVPNYLTQRLINVRIAAKF